MKGLKAIFVYGLALSLTLVAMPSFAAQDVAMNLEDAAAVSITSPVKPGPAAGVTLPPKTITLSNGAVVPFNADVRTGSEEEAFRRELSLLVTLDQLTPEKMKVMGLSEPEETLPKIPVTAKPSELLLNVAQPAAIGCRVTKPSSSAGDMNVSRPPDREVWNKNLCVRSIQLEERPFFGVPT